MKKYIIFICILFATAIAAGAQTKLDNGAEFDKTVHNFGDILLGSGPVSCTYTMTNKGGNPIVIYNVSTTCGCTDVKWTREPIRPGTKGEITVTYSNDEGAYPFDKSLTVYLSDHKKPVILKLRGASIEKPRPLTELYPVHFGALGLKESSMNCGNLDQGESKSGAVMVANISNAPVNLTFKDVSPQLTLSLSRNPIPANSAAELTYTVSSDRNIWGRNTYTAKPIINGKALTSNKGDKDIKIHAFTRENFSKLTDEQKQKGAMPRFSTSTFNFGKAKVGDEINATFTFKNEGKSDFRVYKVDTDASSSSHSEIPTVAPGKSASFSVRIKTAGMAKGESLIIVSLTTNSPTRPIVNLFISGTLE